MTKNDSREKEILSMLKINGRITIKELTKRFSISEVTARRICSKLDENGKAIRSFGGIIQKNISEFGYSFDLYKNSNVEKKSRIGKYSASLVQDSEVIFLESGTTLQYFCFYLSKRIENSEIKNVVIFTNSLVNVEILSDVTKVICVGGEYSKKRRSFSGFISEKTIKNLHFDHIFLGADSINANEGIMVLDLDTVKFDELLMTRSDKVTILSDSSKFENKLAFSYASINEISSIITDTELSQDLIAFFNKKSVKIICV